MYTRSVEKFQSEIDAGAEMPEELDPHLRALWLGRRGDWEGSHDLANELSSPLGSWIHAWLHRVEGDLPNANYWYRLADRAPAEGDLEAEWRALVGAALASDA